MRKFILFGLFGLVTISCWWYSFWYVYKYQDTGFKGLKHLRLSIKLASLIAFILLSFPRCVLGANNNNGLIPASPNIEISGQGLGKHSSEKMEIVVFKDDTIPDHNDDLSSTGNDNNKKSEKPIPYRYYRKSVQEQDSESDSYTEYDSYPDTDDYSDFIIIGLDENQRIKIILSQDGSRTIVPASVIRDNALLIPEFLGKDCFGGKLDIPKMKALPPYARLDYFRNKNILGDKVVYKAQDKVVDVLSEKDTTLDPGSFGPAKIPVTILINARLNKYGIRDNDSSYLRMAGSIDDNEIVALINSNFHIFPNGGE